ncbi:MAG: lactonase family protein [Gammaproteobacteria bacterium]|nr:lactonase family protein [Gammaproteobacteria bacterium]
MLIAKQQDVYFGTGNKHGDGIYYSQLNEKTGTLSSPVKMANIKGPGFLAKHPNLNIIYAVAEIDKQGVVVAYQRSENNTLTEINSKAIGDGRSAHIAVHPSGAFLLTAQYGGSSVALFSLNNQGAIIKREQLIKHEGGSGVVTGRQNTPHPHWVGFSPDGRFAVVPDLGLDQAVIYQIKQNRLEQHSLAISVAGGGPRHMRFSTNGQYIHLLNELSLSITTFAYDQKNGTTKAINTVQTLSEETKSQESFNSASEILVHPTGRFVYSANRGHDSVSVFSSDETTGSLKLIETEHVRGAFPRNINLDLNGQWLLAAGQHSNTVSVFSIDAKSGKLQFQTNSTVNVPEPICILFVK